MLEDPIHKNRINVYVDGDNKYYQLRALKRALPGVVVKVRPVRACMVADDLLMRRG